MVGRNLAKILMIGLLVIFLLSTKATAFKWDFTIEASPVSQTVTAGDGAVFNIKVSAIQSWTTNNNEQTTVDVEFDVPATMTRSLSGPFYLKQSQPTDTRTLTLYTSPDTPPGTYQITLKGTVTSTSTTHSTTISLTVISNEQSKSDLIIQDFYWTPSNPAPGDQVTFTYIEKNQGDGDATGHRVTLYIDDTVISSDNILETLPAGNTRTRTFSDKWTATSGGHDAFVKADSTGGITEINDDNNGLHKTIGTKETVPTALTINLNPSSISENQKTYLTISGKLKNSNSSSGISNRPIKLEWTGGMTTVTTNSNGDYSYATYVTYSKGTYQFSAKFDSYETSSAIYGLSSSTASLIVGEKSIQPPTAYIDSISPNPATKGQYVYFSGSGYDPDGSVVGYNWRSSIDGQLSTSRSFSTSSLTQGTHTIYFKVKDDSGTWSSETARTLTVSSSQPASASIQSASVDKSSYNPGETVKVAVSIKNTGDVDLSGLKINVDIADPNGNNVKATTLQSGISLQAGQTYSTGYINYYTIPSNPISGTYKVTVGLWNSDGSKNYDIQYQTTSFDVKTSENTSTSSLTLDLPPRIEGQDVVFTGKLTRSDTGAGLADMDIKILDKGNLLGDNTLASGKTDKDGKFSIRWIAKQVGIDHDVEIYAKFEGAQKFKSSRFPETGYYFIRIIPQLQPFNFEAIVFPSSWIVVQGTKAEYFIGSYTNFETDPIGDMPTVNLRLEGLPQGMYKLDPSSRQLLTLIGYLNPRTAFVSTLTIDTTNLPIGDYSFKVIEEGGGISNSSKATLKIVDKSPIGARYVLYDIYSKQVDPRYWIDVAAIETINVGVDVNGYIETEVLPLTVDILSGEDPFIIFLNWVASQIKEKNLPLFEAVNKFVVGQILLKSATQEPKTDINYVIEQLQKIPQLIENGNLREAKPVLSSTLSYVRSWRQKTEALPTQTQEQDKVKKGAISILSNLENFLDGELSTITNSVTASINNTSVPQGSIISVPITISNATIPEEQPTTVYQPVVTLQPEKKIEWNPVQSILDAISSLFKGVFGRSTKETIAPASTNLPNPTPKVAAIVTSTPIPKITPSLTLIPSLKRLAIVEDVFNGDVTAAAWAGLERTGPEQGFENGNYYAVDWQGDKYVALNGNTNKLTKLVIEQRKVLRNDGTSYVEKKTLTVGETWDVGGGWRLSIQAIDAKASPRQVWLVLSKDGVKKDDKVIAQGMIYTYVEKSIAGESDVPLFMTYIDSVFVGATNDMAQFSYTWAISPEVEIINN